MLFMVLAKICQAWELGMSGKKSISSLVLLIV